MGRLPSTSWHTLGRVLRPYAGDRFTLKNEGSDDQVDSDINPTDIYTFGSNLISITTSGIHLGFSKADAVAARVGGFQPVIAPNSVEQIETVDLNCGPDFSPPTPCLLPHYNLFPSCQSPSFP